MSPLSAVIGYADTEAFLVAASRLPISLGDCADGLDGVTRAEVVVFPTLESAIKWADAQADGRMATPRSLLPLLRRLTAHFD